MPRKVSLPGADELFRPTQPEQAAPAPLAFPATPASAESPASAVARLEGVASTGRVRHDEKITVYVSRDELLALEQLRLRMRGEFGLSIDRGRIVREALAMVISDVAENGADAALMQRLAQQ